ncbi:hypothetical protein ABD73_03935 [Brevibacillus laterosporus]|nr:hypothetical protein [Brevibacillus laterosporus]
MASGCILGECPLCTEHVYEDECDLDKHDRICHEECLKKGIQTLSITGQVISRIEENGMLILVMKLEEAQ